MYDIIVVGAGPAGMTAALYALRADKKVLVIEKETFGGQITFSPKVENYPGFTERSGNELADRLLEQITQHGADIELAEVTGIKDNKTSKTVITDIGEFESKTVIIATGAKHRHLGVEGEDELIGEGISFCAVCDGAFYTDQRVGVVGGGNSALVEAMMLSETCSEVIIIQNPCVRSRPKLSNTGVLDLTLLVLRVGSFGFTSSKSSSSSKNAFLGSSIISSSFVILFFLNLLLKMS